MRTITVVDYDPGWVEAFEQVRSSVWPIVSAVALSVEHVGSTSVPGLAAKPVIDVDVVLRQEQDLPETIMRLAVLGYQHRDNLGIVGREAFNSPTGLPEHHLYVCPRESRALANHLAVRDYLRAHPETVREYGELKKRLAREFSQDIDGYIDGKTDLIVTILRAKGFPEEEVLEIERVNRR